MSRGFVRGFQRFAVLAAIVASLNCHSVAAQIAPSEAVLADFQADVIAAFDAGGANLRTLVRVGFHDCASALCDGCIDLDDENNNGLAAALNLLTPVCTTHSIGLADCYAAAASTAVDELSGQAVMSFYFGREDGPCTAGTFPDGEDGFDATVAYFADQFGFSERQTVVIMGAHSLGSATPANSGFDGPWTANQNLLDNAFYTDMLEPGWVAEQVVDDNWQWTNNAGRLMLNSDMCLIKDVGVTGEPICLYDDCVESTTTLPIAEEMAANNDQFLTEFGAAYSLMLTKGYNIADLTQAGDDDDTAVAPDGDLVEEDYGEDDV